jgi:hypothetical protein
MNGWLEVARPPAPMAVNRWSFAYPAELKESKDMLVAKAIVSVRISCSVDLRSSDGQTSNRLVVDAVNPSSNPQLRSRVPKIEKIADELCVSFRQII